ncbi:hypothetical protein ABZ477_17870 [Microbacterium sp. NPDC019599]|uniref:hypothetical protein n=1 Tax=Microbacterium sp. NPDC019599 TaxID=3154690 RepID=UPI0033D6C366
MSIQSRRFGATRVGGSRGGRLGLALLLSAGLVACSAPEEEPTTASPEDVVSASLPEAGELDAGTYVVSRFGIPFEITVGEGWHSLDGWALINGVAGEEGAFLTFLAPSSVPTDGCTWRGALVDVDPSVDGFVAALAAQASTATTPPQPIAVDGYAGVEVAINVEDDVVIDACSDNRVCVHSESRTDCSRWYARPTERETYRVMDLDGDRVVLTVGEFAPTSEALAEEAQAVFDSITFVSD